MSHYQELSSAKYFAEAEEKAAAEHAAAEQAKDADVTNDDSTDARSAEQRAERTIKILSVFALLGVLAGGIFYMKDSDILDDGYKYRPRGLADSPMFAVPLLLAGESPEEFNRNFEKAMSGAYLHNQDFQAIQDQMEEQLESSPYYHNP